MQHQVNCRLARAVVVPEAIPPERLRRYGATRKLQRYPGLKEEYYLADFEPDPAVLGELGLDRGRARWPSCARRRRSRSTTASRTPCSRACSSACGASRPWCCRGRPSSRPSCARAGGFIVPEAAIDAQSLIAFADVVISAGGTMNREAVALGTPVYTVFEGRPGAVDERLLADGRLRRLGAADEVRAAQARPRPTARRACVATRACWQLSCSRPSTTAFGA